MLNNLVQISTRRSTPLTIHGGEVLLSTRTLEVRLPGSHGGIIWNRPSAVSIKRQDGNEQIVIVRDVTRLLQLAIFGSALLFVALMPKR